MKISRVEWEKVSQAESDARHLKEFQLIIDFVNQKHREPIKYDLSNSEIADYVVYEFARSDKHNSQPGTKVSSKIHEHALAKILENLRKNKSVCGLLKVHDLHGSLSR